MNINELNSLVVDSLIDGIIVIDKKGVIKQINDSAAQMFGYKIGELLEKNVSMLMPLPHNKAHDAYIEQYLDTGQAKIIGIGREVEALRKSGSLFHIELAITEAVVNEDNYFVGFVRDITKQKESEELLRTNSKIMRAINGALASFINSDIPRKEIFDTMLERLLDITQSEYGFIGEIFRKEDSTPYLKTYAITDVSWNHDTRTFYKENVRNGLEFYNLNTLFGYTIRTGEYLISNDPSNDPRRGGLPAGHPSLNAYLGLPIYSGTMLVGMAGVANRPGGYDEELVYQLKPYMGTMGNLIAGYQNLETRRKAEHELYKAQQALRQLASTDILTGLNNRASLYHQLDEMFEDSKKNDNTFSVMFIDIDYFKDINDNYGHLAGDEILKAVSSLLKNSVRPNDVIGRFGGEEIVIGLPNCSSPHAFELAERIRKVIERSEFRISDDNEVKISLTVSIGISSISPLIDGIDALIDQADKAVYLAKESGRNCTVTYMPDHAKGEANG